MTKFQTLRGQIARLQKELSALTKDWVEIEFSGGTRFISLSEEADQILEKEDHFYTFEDDFASIKCSKEVAQKLQSLESIWVEDQD